LIPSFDCFSVNPSTHPLLFHFDFQEAKVPFMIADSILLVAFHYVDRGLKAERKLAEMEGHRADTSHEMDKTAAKAQKAAQRAAQKSGNKHSGSKAANVDKKFNIQQPSKRD
jgi:hypothetical protein